MQNSSKYRDHLSVLSRALLCFFPTTFLELAVFDMRYVVIFLLLCSFIMNLLSLFSNTRKNT